MLLETQIPPGAPSINIGKSRGTSVNTDTIVQNNDTLGTINFRGADGVDLNGVSAAISAAVDGTPEAMTPLEG